MPTEQTAEDLYARYENLKRIEQSGAPQSEEDRTELSRLAKLIDANDGEPHRISRSETLAILMSPETQEILHGLK